MNNDPTVITTGDKIASFRFISGWGEPGEWYIQMGRTQLVLDNVEGMGNQQEYLQRFVSDKYRLQTISQNWAKVGILDDAIRYCLEYIGYDEQSYERDLTIINSLDRMLVANADALGAFFEEIPSDEVSSFDHLRYNLGMYRGKILPDINQRENIVRVYEQMVKGEKPGIGWTNESLIRDFPGSHEAQLATDFLQGKIILPDDNA